MRKSVSVNGALLARFAFHVFVIFDMTYKRVPEGGRKSTILDHFGSDMCHPMGSNPVCFTLLKGMTPGDKTSGPPPEVSNHEVQDLRVDKIGPPETMDSGGDPKMTTLTRTCHHGGGLCRSAGNVIMGYIMHVRMRGNCP